MVSNWPWSSDLRSASRSRPSEACACVSARVGVNEKLVLASKITCMVGMHVDGSHTFLYTFHTTHLSHARMATVGRDGNEQKSGKSCNKNKAHTLAHLVGDLDLFTLGRAAVGKDVNDGLLISA
jgi:hypothetical protein